MRSLAGHGVADLRRELLWKLGRDGEALEPACADYRQRPSTFSYRDLMNFVPKSDRSAWHKKAIEAAAETDLLSVVGIAPK